MLISVNPTRVRRLQVKAGKDKVLPRITGVHPPAASAFPGPGATFLTAWLGGRRSVSMGCVQRIPDFVNGALGVVPDDRGLGGVLVRQRIGLGRFLEQAGWAR